MTDPTLRTSSAGTQDEILRHLDDIQRSERRGQIHSRLFLLGLIVIVFSIGLSITISVRTNFAPEKLRETVRRELQSLAPVVTESAVELAREVAPVYVNETRRALEASLPAFRHAIDREAQGLAQTVSHEAKERLGESALSIIEEQMTAVCAEFPMLADEQFVTELVEKASSDMSVELESMIEEVLAAYTEPMRNLVSATDSYPRLTHLTERELQRRFLRLWLKFFDLELDASGSEIPTTTARTDAAISSERS